MVDHWHHILQHPEVTEDERPMRRMFLYHFELLTCQTRRFTQQRIVYAYFADVVKKGC